MVINEVSLVDKGANKKRFFLMKKDNTVTKEELIEALASEELINKISDKWIKLYMNHKATALKVALDNKRLPAICKIKERWHNRKCLDYCNVSNSCPYGHMLKIKHNREIS